MKRFACPVLLATTLCAALLVGCATATPSATSEETPAETSATATAEQPTTAKIESGVQYVLFVGTSDSKTHQPVYPSAMCLDMTKTVLTRRLGTYIIQEAQGSRVGEDGSKYQDYTMVIYLYDVSEDEARSVASELGLLFNQDSVLIQGYQTTTEVCPIE